MAPSVTYILCCYNQAPYLREAVLSALDQDYAGEVEYVITDDGSTDGSAAMLADLVAEQGRPNLRLISDGKNLGLTHRLNQAIGSTSGELVILQACDDVARRDRITTFVDYYSRNPSANICYADAARIDAQGGRISEEFRSPLHRQVAGDVNRPDLIRLFAIGCNESFRRDVMRRLGPFEEGERAAEDHQLVLLSLGSGGIHFIPRVTLDYRVHGQNWCGAGNDAAASAFDWERLRRSARSTLTNAEITLRLLARPALRAAMDPRRHAVELARGGRSLNLHLLRWRALGGDVGQPFFRLIPRCAFAPAHILFSIAIRMGGRRLASLIWSLNSALRRRQ